MLGCLLASSSDPKREFGELRSRASMRSYLAVSSIAVAINNECFVMVLIDETSCEMVLNETLHEKRTSEGTQRPNAPCARAARRVELIACDYLAKSRKVR